MLPVLIFPQFDPVLLHLGPISIRWYALAYIVGLVAGWRLMRRLVTWSPVAGTPLDVDDFLTWATLGVVLGGRIGYVLFYQSGLYLSHPAAILEVWHGGMSFHGGALGVILAIILFALKRRLPMLLFADRVCTVVPIGLGLGRIANFINGELWGRPAPASLPWAMIFPNVDQVPRHPSELYQALLEGLLLFGVMIAAARQPALRARPGLLSGLFLAGYAVARMIGEMFRQPDAFLGFLAFGVTMGQLLSVPMLIAGLGLMLNARMRPALAS
jgi:phosphatidylglycerol:prolipoprotein diacylglycerol transferase